MLESRASRSTSVYTHTEIARLKEKCGLIPQPNEPKPPAKTKAEMAASLRAKQANLIREQKEQERFRRFEAQQLKRRQIDQEEARYQAQLRAEELARAKAKVFFNSDEVRKLKSGMLLSNTLQERDEQLQLQKELREIQRNREEQHHRMLMAQKEQAERAEMLKMELAKKRRQQNAKEIRRQHEQMKRKFVAELREAKMEGQQIKLQSQEKAALEKQKQDRIKARQIELAKSLQEANLQKADRKDQEVQEQLLKQLKRQQYLQQQQLRVQLVKQKQKMTQQARQEVIGKVVDLRATELKSKLNLQPQMLRNQEKQIRERQQKAQKQKQQKLNRQKQLIDQSRALNMRKREMERQAQEQALRRYQAESKKMVAEVEAIEKQTKEGMKNREKALSLFHQRQAEEHTNARERRVREEFAEEEEIRRQRQEEASKVRSFAEQCTREWSERGRNVLPLLKTMRTLK